MTFGIREIDWEGGEILIAVPLLRHQKARTGIDSSHGDVTLSLVQSRRAVRLSSTTIAAEPQGVPLRTHGKCCVLVLAVGFSSR